jgi:YaiO family outer membrane protein
MIGRLFNMSSPKPHQPRFSERAFMSRNVILALSLGLINAHLAWAQTGNPSPDAAVLAQTPATNDQSPRTLEVSTSLQNLTGGYGQWHDLTVRGTYNLGQHVLQGEGLVARRVGRDGAFIGLSDTYTFNEDWYGSLAIGAGDGAFYLPRYRVDATLYRKLLQDRRLVGSFGAGYYNAPDGHTERSLSLGAVYYFAAPWVAEGGVRFNVSNPGTVRTHQQFLALTWGRDMHDVVTARYMWGGEGYLAIAADRQLVNFNSREASVTWRHWLNPQTGILVGVNQYSNPSYRRRGVNAGIFHNF